jgi:hypothetical protein
LLAAGATRLYGKLQCPAHALDGDQHSCSLSIHRSREDGTALIKCFAGCDWRMVLNAMRLTPNALWVEPSTPPDRYALAFLRHLRFPPPRLTRGEGYRSDNGGRSFEGPPRTLRKLGFQVEAIHKYRLRGGTRAIAAKVRYRHAETGEKQLRWMSANGRECRDLANMVRGLPPGVREADLALFWEDKIPPDGLVVLCESESSCGALRFADRLSYRNGIAATTWAGGAHSPPADYLAQVLGRHPNVVFIPDNNPAGLASREKVMAALPRARMVLGEPGEDARDMLNRLGLEQMKELLERPTD